MCVLAGAHEENMAVLSQGGLTESLVARTEIGVLKTPQCIDI